MSIKWSGDPVRNEDGKWVRYPLEVVGEHQHGVPLKRMHPFNMGARYRANGPREMARRLRQRSTHG